MSRRNIQVFNMSFLDMMTNFLGAVIILLLLAMKDLGKKPCPSIATQENVFFDPVSGKIHGKLAALSEKIGIGDSILAVVQGFEDFPKPGAPAVCTRKHYEEGATSSGNVAGKCSRQHCEDPDCVKSAQTAIAVTVQPSGCNDKNTSDAADDSYSVVLIAQKIGSGGSSSWSDGSGKSYPYGQPATLGPFTIAQGNRNMTIYDANNPSIRQQVTAFAPPSCSRQTVSGGATTGSSRVVGYIPPGKQFILFWENDDDKVHLRVEASNGEKLTGMSKRQSWGEWYRDKGGLLGRTTMEAVKITAPGTYKVQATLSRGASVPVKLAITSSEGQRFSQEYAFSLSQDMLLKEVEVTADGKIIVK